MYIQSSSNDRVKEIKKLISSSKERRVSGTYVVEGIRMFREIPSSDVCAIYLSEEADENCKKEAEKLFEMADGVDEIITTSQAAFKAMSDTETPQGILAVVRTKVYDLDDVLENGDVPCLLIADRLQDPGNLGTILRTAEAAGITGVILSKDSVDIYNPKTVRSTMGSIFRMPVYASENLVNDISVIKSKGVKIYGTHLKGNEFYDNDYTEACGFLIGNEGRGLSDEVSETADSLIRIPMMGKVESLNAATSVAVVGYEVLRQRR